MDFEANKTPPFFSASYNYFGYKTAPYTDIFYFSGQLCQKNGTFSPQIMKSIPLINSPYLDSSTIAHKIFETNSSFHVK